MNNTLFYRCEKCGNIVAVVKAGGGTLSCCGQEMTRLNANSTDAAKEKHVPVAVVSGDKIEVTVGSVKHPMLAEHYIEWIALVTDERVEIVHLKPGIDPVAHFSDYDEDDELANDDEEEIANCEGQPCNFVYKGIGKKKTVIYEYCNLHGLWKTEI